MNNKITFKNSNFLDAYSNWESPKVIICDGPYGVSGFEGDTDSPEELPLWYEKYIKAISDKSTPETTLWFWNTEIGWALVHPILEKYGWEYKCCNIWNKGMSHVAGNVNTKTLSKFPIVSEVCVQYVKKPFFYIDNKQMTMKEWLRYEWEKTGLPFSKTNEACGVKNVATRKYFTKCHLWYMPPTENFIKLVDYANKYGNQQNKPFFSLDGIESMNAEQWDKMRATFKCPYGYSNIWNIPQLMSKERMKCGTKAIHLNQKPLEIIKMLVEASSNEGDVIWDPFAGLATTAIACIDLNRKCYLTEINKDVFEMANNRIEQKIKES